MAPTDSLPVVRYDAKAGERSLDVLRWGLVPYWAKDIKVGFANINAKAEGIETKPAFREASGSGAVCCRSIILCCNRIVGNLALAGGRAGAQFYHRYDHAERAVRGAPQPDAGGAEARELADLAWGSAGRRAAAQGPARAVPGG